jgi:ubiquinone/menaquinone biosynthesis C-methylase UbiE
MRKPKSDPGARAIQRAGMRRWGHRNAPLYDSWTLVLSAFGYRRMVRYVLSLLPETGTAVDVGCGTGEFLRCARARRSGLTLIACDLAPEFLSIAARRHAEARPLCADAERLPLRDHAADASVSLGVLGHLLTFETAIAELARVVRPGGVIAVWTRTDCGASRVVASIFHWTNPGVAFRLHRPEGVRSALERSGVRIEREKPVAGGVLWIGTRTPD